MSKRSNAHLMNSENDVSNKIYTTRSNFDASGSPLSNISNGIPFDIYNREAAEKRKARKLILDNRKAKVHPSTLTSHNTSNVDGSSTSGVSNVIQKPVELSRTPLLDISNVVNRIAAEKRKARKLILDNRRSKLHASTLRLQNTTLLHTNNNRISYGKKIASSSNTSVRHQRTSISSVNESINSSDVNAVYKCFPVLKSERAGSTGPSASNTSNIMHNEDIHVDDIVRDPFVGISRDYLDHGDQSLTCGSCYAKLWKNEGVHGRTNNGITNYLLCCGYGKVQLPSLKAPDLNYKNLFTDVGSKSKYFLNNIRRYNSIFSFTSMGGKVDNSINNVKAPYIFRLSGQNFHRIGSLLPLQEGKPKFSQLYIYDTDNEVSNRKTVCGQQDGRTYNLPTTSEIAALIVGDITDSYESRDIIVEMRSGELKHISELHPSYIGLHYPIIFPYGEDCYRIDIPHRATSSSSTKNLKKCTMREFFAYRIQDRDNEFSLILISRRLYQQFLVDGYTMIESERLFWVRHQQKHLRCETYENLRNLHIQGNADVSSIGTRVILPSSFTGGARYMMQNYLDAMALCKWFGYPDFFITITCNPKWPEIKRFLKVTNINPEDRPDILSRIFKMKLDSIIKDLKDKKLLGRVSTVVYTVEFQKRGLPHAHLCLFLHPDHKLPGVENVDQFICAEIPDEKEDPTLYSLVKEFMMHGPCGAANLKCSCMIDKRCSKNFPKKFSNATSLDSDGFPIYRRRDSGSYLSVMHLPFHLPGQQQVVYEADEDIENVLEKASVNSSMFTSWMACNQHDDLARQLTYVEFPSKFVWVLKDRKWERRKKGFSVGRIHHVSPSLGEAYFLRVLLNKVKGPRSFAEIKTVNGVTYATFRDACYALGLLDDDSEYIEAIQEASQSGSGFFLRNLFASMLMSNSISRPEFVWEKTWEYLSDDILYQQRRILNIPDLSLTEEQLKNLTLYEIEKFLLRNNYSLRRFSTMPYPDNESLSSSNNHLISQELSAIEGDNGGVFFVYSYGGTGKTFLWKTLSASIRSKGEIVLNVASSVIASLLLPGGRTTHSRFGIPINLTEVLSCGIKKNTEAVHLLKKTKLIIWDEAPMTHKHAFEALDKTLKDMLGQSGNINNERPFGGKVVVFGGDFRQTLPVIQGGTRQEIVNASLCSSYLWGT
ncbi:uncharacterized protein LOC143533936 [Bidens hawaiensis]|uniref:uncharacterized protein LOC143533936 n=1 Tax=Bidens hawaiensis TaxID=980011 RepID=UPI00404A517D